MKTNKVHCYITGFKFDNIYGEQSDDYSRSITHIKYMSPMMTQKWPWMKNMWFLSDGRGFNSYHKTLQEAKEVAQSR
jgi:hypothetical protein